jgi:hypothetical protein
MDTALVRTCHRRLSDSAAHAPSACRRAALRASPHARKHPRPRRVHSPNARAPTPARPRARTGCAREHALRKRRLARGGGQPCPARSRDFARFGIPTATLPRADRARRSLVRESGSPGVRTSALPAPQTSGPPDLRITIRRPGSRRLRSRPSRGRCRAPDSVPRDDHAARRGRRRAIHGSRHEGLRSAG